MSTCSELQSLFHTYIASKANRLSDTPNPNPDQLPMDIPKRRKYIGLHFLGNFLR